MARSVCSLLAAAVLGLVATVSPAAARISPAPEILVQSVASLSPDGRTMTVQVLASCLERWSVVEASVTVTQPGASGSGSFPLTCIGSLRPFVVTVRASGADFQLGDALVSATVVIERGRTARADDSLVVPVQPVVLVELADFARLESGNTAVVMDVTVTCHPETTGLESTLVVSQSVALGIGRYTPICDGTPHTFGVRVDAAPNVYDPAFVAQALTFAQTDFAGQIVYGIDDDGALELVS